MTLCFMRVMTKDLMDALWYDSEEISSGYMQCLNGQK